MIRMCVKHFFTRRGPRSSWISKTRHLPSWRSAWARAGARLTAEQLAIVFDLNPATTTIMPAGVRLLEGGSGHLQGATRGRPITGLFQKTCVSTMGGRSRGAAGVSAPPTRGKSTGTPRRTTSRWNVYLPWRLVQLLLLCLLGHKNCIIACWATAHRPSPKRH
jgi:hypothetical protein